MKSTMQFAVSSLALGALLAGPAAQATDIATLPLKASVLAKPNVIFGLDDSGSMDSELMLGNNDGAFWWDYNAGTGWNAAGVTHFNAVGSAGTQWRKMVYLFPNGTGTGNRIYIDAENDHFAIPPTAQFAFVRSPDYNPIYFNPAVTYKPWAPAYVGGATVTYGNASKTAAKSHPVYGTGTFNVSATFSASTSTDWTFTALTGMQLPGTAKVLDSGTWKTVSTMGWATSGSLFVVPANRKFRLSMDYFPATYYLRETCTVDGAACVSAPDGLTLKRYEIKAANYATTAAYDAAIQNFANWWQYYRKRKLMLNAAVGQVLEPLTGLRMGVMKFNSRPNATTRVTMYDTDAAAASANGRKVAGIFYETNGDGGTPTRETLNRIGEEYMNAAGPVQYACQRNNAFIMTDGFANVASPTKPAYSKATWGSGAPYATTYDNSLADVALAYYTVNLRTGLATGRVPKTSVDENVNLHMNTYGLTMGARGLLFTSETAARPTETSAWTDPTQNRHPSAVDDLWHATINGRGQMYLADSPAETAAKIQNGLRDILSQTGAQGGIAVSTVNLSRGDSRAYFGTYNPAGWAGDLTANPISAETAEVDTTPVWSASTLLLARDWSTRIIAAGKAGGAVGFTAGDVGGTVNPGGIYGTDAEVLDYLRGERTHEGTKFRSRTSLMGAVINSEPMVARDEGVVYVQSGEGMLHAFDTRSPDAGKELWAFVPESVLPHIGETVERAYAFASKLDGSPVVAKLSNGSKLLVAGAGAAGRSYFALDVSSPRSLTEAQLAAAHRWTFPPAGNADLVGKVGDALGRPIIVKSASDGDVVLITSGYNNTGGQGRMWMLNASTGTVIHEFEVSADVAVTEAGLAQVSAFMESNGTVRYVYGGDLQGNLWRFDLTDKGAPTLVAVLKGPLGDRQPVTAAPELVLVNGKRVVLVGTGRLLDIGDFGSTKVQTFYAIADGATLSNARSGLTQRTYNAGDDSLSGDTVNWATGRGWYLDLPAGVQVNTRPTLAYGAVAFVTNANGGSDCAASSRLWLLDLLSGDEFPGSDYVSTLISDIANSSGVTALLTSEGKIIGSGQDADGKPWQRDITKSNPIVPAKNAWREIRRQ
jgi:type IV pilus assembly protein PilY1